jgi:type VI secretion system protein ImpL
LRNTLLAILKYFLLVTCVALVLLLVLGLVYAMAWPWWVGAFLLLALVGMVIGGLFLKRLLQRRKERQFVQEVIEQDNEKLKSLASAGQSQHQELQERWKEAVGMLRRSHLKKRGNPLYVLPWYLLMGESGSGKSTALTSARLSSPFAEVTHAAGISGTSNCDWWFFDQSIIIDTAGRYAIPEDSVRDNEEWQKFLSLLVKYRRKEPIHGMIMTISADKLLNNPPEDLEKDGLQLRRRLDELMRVLSIKFPVYVLVTKCDLVQGMTPFTGQFADKTLEQPMGFLNSAGASTDLPGFVDRALSSITDRLKDLRILMLNSRESSSLAAAPLLFPDEFLSLRAGLESFVKAAFQENPYQDTPLLRGLYFSSARQEGTPYSHLLGSLGLIAEKEVLPGVSKGLFLHDFFAKLLPGDQRLFAPTTRAMQWQILTRNLGLTSWVVVWIALCGLLSYSFVKNLATIRTASAAFANAPELKGEFRADVNTMDQYRKMIKSVEEQNSHWWLPRFGLQESVQVESALKTKYCRQFHGRFLASFDKGMSDTIASFSPATSDALAGEYFVHLVRRINLLKYRMQGDGLGQLEAKPLPSYVISSAPSPEDVENTRRFGLQYLNYLMWRADNNDLAQEISLLQSLLKQIVVAKGAGMQWLPEWINRQGVAPALTLQTFWGGTRAIKDDVSIPAAYTRKGHEAASSFLEELKNAYPEPLALDKDRGAFDGWYQRNCYSAWLRFAAVFPKGAERLVNTKEWSRVAEQMATDQGPYFAFLAQLHGDLSAFAGKEPLPPLLQQLYQFQQLKAAGASGGVASKAVEEGKKLSEKVGYLVGKKPQGAASLETLSATTRAVKDYHAALAAIAPSAKSRTQAFQLALQVFSEDPIASKSPFYQASEALQRITGGFAGAGKTDDAFQNIVSGPLAFLWSFVRMESACSLQSQWEEKVLRESQGASDPQALQFLLSPDGPVWKFVNASLGPFQGWSPQRGYYAKAALGGSLNFDPAFVSFLAKGSKVKLLAAQPAKKTSNTVAIKGLPTDANADARTKPQSTRLELQCASGAQAIENLNFPVAKTFSWAPDTCADVTFQIDIGELVLTRQYAGPQGFPAFLRDFQGGRHTFYPQDFPREKEALDRMGVRFIRANYQFSGMLDLAGQGGAAAGLVPGSIPGVITKCWD